MKVAKLEDMVKGWFVGNFDPTNDVEVAVKEYKKGDYEEKHYHKIATEITVIVKMNTQKVIEPNEALEDTVVKFPGVSNLGERNNIVIPMEVDLQKQDMKNQNHL